MQNKNIVVKTKFNTPLLDFISDQLKGTIFSGWVSEREYVEHLTDYRDKVEVDGWEEDIIRKLKNILLSVRGALEGHKWINITDSSLSRCYCLWVLLERPPSPGHYWLQVKDVSVDAKFGLKINLEILREISPFDGESWADRERRLNGADSVDEWKELAKSLGDVNFAAVCNSLSALVTPSNITQAVRFAVVLSVTLLVSFATFLQHFCHYFILFLREFGVLIQRASPLAQSVIQFIEKMVGGFYLLLVMIYRDMRTPRPPPPPPEPRPIQPSRPLPSITYVPPEAWSYKSD